MIGYSLGNLLLPLACYIMQVEHYIPSPALSPFIKGYIIINSNGDELVNRILPGTAAAMAFRLQGQTAYVSNASKTALPTTSFSGLRKSVRLINYAPGTVTLVVLFKETGVAAFFKQPLHELFEESISLAGIFPQSSIYVLEQQLAEAGNYKAAVGVVEHFLLSKLIHNKPDALVNEAIRRIYIANGMGKISTLTSELFISQDAFEKRFRKATGAAPKQFSSIVKMKSLIQHTSAYPTFLDMALEKGYYDQAHFNKAFKLFTGLTPASFFASDRYW